MKKREVNNEQAIGTINVPNLQSQYFEVSIVNSSGYMQDRMHDDKLKKWEEQRGKIIERDDINKDDITKALAASYIEMPNGNRKGKPMFYLPIEHLEQSMVNGGKLIKGKVGNATRSMTNIVAAQFSVYPFNEDKIYIPPFDNVDQRSVVNHITKARVMKYRPVWYPGSIKVKFFLEVKNDSITNPMVASILFHAFTFAGVGNYRAQHKGKFGVFRITELKKLGKRPKAVPAPF